MKLAIRWKLVLAIGLPLLLIYALILSASLIHLRKRAFSRLEENMSRLAAQYAARVEARVDGVAEIARGMAAIGIQADTSEDELHTILRSMVSLDDMVHAARFAFEPTPPPRQIRIHYARRSEGEIVSSDWELNERRAGSPEWSWYERAAAESSGWWSDPYLDEASGLSWICSYAVPVRVQGRLLGVVAVDISIPELRRHIGGIDIEGGDFVILGRDGTVLSHPLQHLVLRENYIDIAQRRGRPDAVDLGQRMIRGERGFIRIMPILSQEDLQGATAAERSQQLPAITSPVWVFYAPVASTGWSFAAGAPETEVTAFSNSQMKIAVTFMAGGLLLILVSLLIVSSRITRPLVRLAWAVEKVSKGDLEARVSGEIPRDEVGDVSLAFNKMVADLKEHTEALTRETAAREAVESELRVARTIQTSLLPGSFPPFPERKEFDLHALNLSARQVAGDFFDFFFTSQGSLILVMADVSGKGVPAALLMAVTRTILRNACRDGRGPGEALSIANQTLCADNLGSMYVTLFLGSYDSKSGKMRYANAGHPSPYRISHDGTVAPFGETTGPILGILDGARFDDRLETLAPGDRLVLYTDGVPEAVGADDEFYGQERLVAFLKRHGTEPVDRLCELLAEETDVFQGMERQDDTTILALKRN